MSDNWLIYMDKPHMFYDVIEDDPTDLGALGSNWQPATCEAAKEFLKSMSQEEGWHRGHLHAPRF